MHWCHHSSTVIQEFCYKAIIQIVYTHVILFHSFQTISKQERANQKNRGDHTSLQDIIPENMQ